MAEMTVQAANIVSGKVELEPGMGLIPEGASALVTERHGDTIKFFPLFLPTVEIKPVEGGA